MEKKPEKKAKKEIMSRKASFDNEWLESSFPNLFHCKEVGVGAVVFRWGDCSGSDVIGGHLQLMAPMGRG